MKFETVGTNILCFVSNWRQHHLLFGGGNEVGSLREVIRLGQQLQ